VKKNDRQCLYEADKKKTQCGLFSLLYFRATELSSITKALIWITLIILMVCSLQLCAANANIRLNTLTAIVNEEKLLIRTLQILKKWTIVWGKSHAVLLSTSINLDYYSKIFEKAEICCSVTPLRIALSTFDCCLLSVTHCSSELNTTLL